MTKAIVWFRKDLRLEDNPALDRAVELGLEIIPVFIYAPEEESFKLGSHELNIGAASKVWLHYALKELPELIIREGNSLEELEKLIQEIGATHLFWNRRYEPFIIERDKKIKDKFSKQITVESFNGSLLVEPWHILNQQENPYKVFTPYYKKIKDIDFGKTGKKHKLKKTEYKSLKLKDLKLVPSLDWSEPIIDFWGLDTSKKKSQFKAENYSETRDRLDLDGTSKLAPYLAWGQVSPRQIWNKYINQEGTEAYTRQLIWREFSYYLMYHFPETITEPLNKKFKDFDWEQSSINLTKWQKGQTGYSVVDAAMNQLWQTGWMHNRARMIVASFLCKDLLIHWHEGAAWFWNTLVDADLANNTMGWQWVAGSGADASPYYRIFNPETQSSKFDPSGDYKKQWLNNTQNLMIDHKFARERALERYKRLKNNC